MLWVHLAAATIIRSKGVTNSVPFDRATIVDTTGNDDDEYFGQFYMFAVPNYRQPNLPTLFVQIRADYVAFQRPP